VGGGVLPGRFPRLAVLVAGQQHLQIRVPEKPGFPPAASGDDQRDPADAVDHGADTHQKED